MKYCTHCGTQLEQLEPFVKCPNCQTAYENADPSHVADIGKQRGAAVLLAVLLGCFGVHLFYMEKLAAGCCYLGLTVLSMILYPFWDGAPIFAALAAIFSLMDVYTILSKPHSSFVKFVTGQGPYV